MTHRDSTGPVIGLKLVTLLFTLSPELLFLGAGLKLKENGYDGLLVAINPRVPEDLKLITNIKEMITEASFYLFNATKRRVFFRNVQILVPATWTDHNYSRVRQESYDKANVIVAEQSEEHGDDPYTLQHRGCGQEGRYIHFTPSFLLNDELAAGYGARGRVFVHEWAHLRWGVFDEYNNDKPFYVNGRNEIALLDPSGRKYNTGDFIINLAFRTASLKIPGTAKHGHWTYTLNNTHHSPQALKVTVASRASSLAMSPATLEAFVERDSTYFPQPVIIYANVRKGLHPILNATVVATVEPEAGDPVVLQLLDGGAGADVIRNDGIYSR